MQKNQALRSLCSRIKKTLFQGKNNVVFVCLISYVLLLISGFGSAQFFGGNTDFLEQVFSPSKSQQQVINIGNDTRSVGNEILRESTSIQFGEGIVKREPLIVRFTKLLLRLTMVLSVSMVIYTGIRYILSAGQEEGMKNARQNLLYIILGILLAMMSYGIIILIESIGFSTLSGF